MEKERAIRNKPLAVLLILFVSIPSIIFGAYVFELIDSIGIPLVMWGWLCVVGACSIIWAVILWLNND